MNITTQVNSESKGYNEYIFIQYGTENYISNDVPVGVKDQINDTYYLATL